MTEQGMPDKPKTDRQIMYDLQTELKELNQELTRVQKDLAEVCRRYAAARLTIAEMEKAGKLVLADRDEAVALLKTAMALMLYAMDDTLHPEPANRWYNKARSYIKRIGGGS